LQASQSRRTIIANSPRSSTSTMDPSSDEKCGR
jgi:hypothetical protein